MKVVVSGVSKGRREHALPTTSATFASGVVTLATAETAQRPTVLGLIASGRMRPDTGVVEIDGRRDAAALRRRVALVDAPGVSEPEPNVTLAGVAAEELMFAGRRSDPFAVRRWLDEQGLGGSAALPVSNVDADERVRALCELAVLRTGVEGIVLVSPDRHGGSPDGWRAIAQDLASRGLAVLVIAGEASTSVEQALSDTDRPPGHRPSFRLVASLLAQRPGGRTRSTPVVERGQRDETTTPHRFGSSLRLARLTARTRGGRS